MSVPDTTAAYTVDRTFVAAPRPSVHGFLLDGEMVLYDEVTGTLHHLNPQAALIWRCLDGSGPLSDLVGDLSEAYRIAPEAVEGDVVALVGELATNGLLHGCGPEAVPDGTDIDPTAPQFLPEPPAP